MVVEYRPPLAGPQVFKPRLVWRVTAWIVVVSWLPATVGLVVSLVDDNTVSARGMAPSMLMESRVGCSWSSCSDLVLSARSRVVPLLVLCRGFDLVEGGAAA